MKNTSIGLTETPCEFDPADISDAAYRVMLHHGLGDNWLHIQLALWHAMTEHLHHLNRVNQDTVPKTCTNQDLHHSVR